MSTIPGCFEIGSGPEIEAWFKAAVAAARSEADTGICSPQPELPRAIAARAGYLRKIPTGCRVSARFGRRRMMPAAAILCGCLMALPLWVGIIWGLSAVLRHMGVAP